MQIRTDVIVEKLISIISLVKVEITLNSLLEWLCQWLPIIEPLECEYPMVEVLTTVRIAHLYLILLYDLADLIHNDWKNTDTDHHANDCEDHFKITDWKEVAITNSS